MNARKKQQLKKLEEIADKYKERNKDKEEKKPINRKDKSQIPIPKKTNVKNNTQPVENSQENKVADVVEEAVVKDVELNVKKPKTIANTTAGTVSKEKKVVERKKVPDNHKKKNTVKKETRNTKLVKEISMSLDSLEDCQSIADKNCASIGINTEFLCPCVPCVIYENVDQNPKSNRKSKTNDKTVAKNVDDHKIELLYKNPTMVSSCDIQAKIKTQADPEDLMDSNMNICIFTKSICDNDTSDNIDESLTSFQDFKINSDDICVVDGVEVKENSKYESYETNNSLTDDVAKEMTEELHDLSAEHYDESYEHDVSGELSNPVDNKCNSNDQYDNVDDEEENDIVCRHGSGDTYTKFTENPGDLEEFLNITDKMMSSHYADEDPNIEKDLDHIHTPRTNSLETIHDKSSDNNTNQKVESSKYNFSDSLQELKNDFKHLLESAGDDNVSNALKKTDEDEGNVETNRKVCDMEHITVYQLKFYEEKPSEDKILKNVASEFKLPSISQTNKPERKVACNKSRMQKIYKPNRRYKMLSEQNRTNTENQTFIVKENEDDKSDEQSITNEAPPLKLPRIENKRLEYNIPSLIP